MDLVQKEQGLIATTTDQIIHFYSSQFSKVPKALATLLLGL